MSIVAAIRFAALALGAGACVSCSQGSQPRSEPIPVELWYLGDFGGTLRFSNAVEEALRASPAFRISSGQNPGTLIVRIPVNVEWTELADRDLLTYRVEFQTATGKSLGSTTGTCWNDELSLCAEFVVKQAEIAARRMELER
jgi:hypothetical protein